MSARKKSSDRRRSRPVEKKSPITQFKRNKTSVFLVIFIIFMLVFSGFYVIFTSFGSNDNSNIGSGNPVATIDTTEGEIKVELYKNKTPVTCNNFVKLANDGFYNGLVFHRVIDDFMIQAGGFYPDGSRKDSPYGNIEFESSDLSHVDGAISMASTGAKVGGSSQFFICDGAQPGLDGNYAVFGKVVEGMDVVRDIASVQTTSKYGMNDWPEDDIIINEIFIE